MMTEKEKYSSNGTTIAAVWSRKVDLERLAGRPRMILAVRQVMDAVGPTTHLYLENLLQRRTVARMIRAAWTAAGELLRFRLPSFQCLLFSDAANQNDLLQQLRTIKPSTLYCDGVRSLYLLRRLGPLRSSMHIVIDMDDLMSRRMELLKESGLGLSLGYMSSHAPSWIKRFLTHPLLARVIAGWESLALRQVEDELGEYANIVVLISPVEASELARRYATNGASARVAAIAPPAEIVAPPSPYPTFRRFAFIGTDALPQNQSTIARLLDLWTRFSPAAKLDVYGNMTHSWAPPPRVRFHGYAESLSDVYTEGTVLLAPGVLRGGVKTKVVEAFSYGCAVVGNDITFEGLGLESYPLILNDDAMLKDLLTRPEAHLDRFRSAASIGSDLIVRAFSKRSFEQAWTSTLTVESNSSQPT